MSHAGGLRRIVPPLILLIAAVGCATGHGVRDHVGPRRAPRNGAGSTSLDPMPVYQRAGLLASAEPIPFAGSVRYLGGASPDSTLVLLSLSLANHALTFATEEDGPSAAYTVVADVRNSSAAADGPPVRHVEAHEIVRVASPKEAARTDPSIVFQHFMTLAPGVYTLTVSVQDDRSVHNSSQDIRLAVPRLDAGTLSSPVAVYQITARARRGTMPRLIANPRATAVFGRDSTVTVYLEGYDLPPAAQVAVRTCADDGTELWRDTVTMQTGGASGAVASARIDIPIVRIGVGAFEVDAVPVQPAAPASDTVRTPVFVSFFDDGAIASFDDMLSYLRYFTTPDQLDALRKAAPADRAAAWASFWAATDPVPSTPEHEGIRTYFARLETANARFRDEGGPGWLTDRGRVFIMLGEPEQIVEPALTISSDRYLVQTWVYSDPQLELMFVNRIGPGGQWQLTQASEAQFESAVQQSRGRS